MKRSQVMTIIFTSIFSLIGSYYGVKAVLGDPENKKETITQPVEISSDLAMPDPEIFNLGAVNPTIEVYIGSCVDINQNGILEPTEKLECATPENAKNINKKNASKRAESQNNKPASPSAQPRPQSQPQSQNKPQSQASQPPNNGSASNQGQQHNEQQGFVAPPHLGASSNVDQENPTAPPDLSKEPN